MIYTHTNVGSWLTSVWANQISTHFALHLLANCPLLSLSTSTPGKHEIQYTYSVLNPYPVCLRHKKKVMTTKHLKRSRKSSHQSRGWKLFFELKLVGMQWTQIGTGTG